MDERRARPGARRVVVTGLGAVSGCGWGAAALWDKLAAGRTAIRVLDRFDPTAHRTKIAAQAPAPPPDFTSVPRGSHLSLADHFALFAAIEALRGAGLGAPLGRESGVYFGSSTGGFWESEQFYDDVLFGSKRPRRIDLLASQQCSAPGEAVARALGVRGPVETISSACASGTLALGAAIDAVRSGEVTVALAGGADSLCQLTYAGFNSLRSVDESPCRPFRAGRLGLSLGEGAAALVLEDLSHARSRGARPWAELLGWGASCDAGHMTAPDPTGGGPARAISDALADAGLPPGAIAFVNAHGTGTPHNDSAEWTALRLVFGDLADRLPVTATKGIVGHLLGSAGVIEAVATVLCLHHGAVHPTPSGGPVDPASPVRLVLGAPLPIPADARALSTSLGFGGANAAVVIGAWPGDSA